MNIIMLLLVIYMGSGVGAILGGVVGAILCVLGFAAWDWFWYFVGGGALLGGATVVVAGAG